MIKIISRWSIFLKVSSKKSTKLGNTGINLPSLLLSYATVQYLNGIPFFSFGDAKVKFYIPLSVIPDFLKKAVIVTEDADFYSHSGFSPKAIARALLDNIKERNLNYGASTITQQLVKNSFLKTEKKFFRKYQEILIYYRR